MSAAAHLLRMLSRGRFSESARDLAKAIEQFSDDPRIVVNMRSHLLRDAGELSISLGNYDQAVEYLNRAKQLEEKAPPTAGSALTLALFAQAEMAEKDFESAEREIEFAEASIARRTEQSPLMAARIDVLTLQASNQKQ